MDKPVVISDMIGMEGYSSRFSSFGGEYVFSCITDPTMFQSAPETPVRVDGLTFMLVLKGNMEIESNHSSTVLSPNSLISFGPQSLLRMRVIGSGDLEVYLFVVSRSFMSDINLDIKLLHSPSVKSGMPEAMLLSVEETSMMKGYIDLIHFNTLNNSDPQYVRGISRSLIAALLYQLILFIRKHAGSSPTVPVRSRRSNYLKEFMRLLHTHHRRERSVAFYASQLYITPKYLSLLIKEATGRSAAEWIDEFVIMEAKNMLRFSGKNVQQVAYDLNFPNQSAFGKYFKHLTGMSPTRFQRS